MARLKTLSVLAVVAVGFVVSAYAVAYAVTTRTVGDPVQQAPIVTTGGQPIARSDLPDANTQIAFWSKRAASNPRSYIELTYLGQAYARKARETGDVAHYLRAKAALRRALRVNPGYVQARASLATLLFSLHHFRAALALARPIVDDPRGLQALATFGDAHAALGSYGRARAAYARLARFGASAAADSRLALLSDLEGEADEALALLARAARLAHESGDYGESLSWYAYHSGEVAFRAGRIELAESHYREARRLFPTSPLALGGLAKVAAAQRRFEEAISYYRRATAIVPQPELLAALGDVYVAMGRKDAARRQYGTVELIGTLAKVNRQVYNRQLAIFYADHDLRVGEARRLALAELRARKDIYGYDAAAWASYKAGHVSDAVRFSERALSLGTRDPELLYHAGMIARAAGDIADAKDLLAEALRLNPRFDPLQAPVARSVLEGLS